jgi:predicted nuclease with TOPRIM domain
MKIKLIIAIIVVSTMTTGYFYIQALSGQLEAAQAMQEKMEDVIKQQEVVMEKQKEDMKKMQEVNKEISEKVNRAQSEVNELNKKFANRDLAAIASANPTETEKRVNRGTKDALRCNEIVTGAPLTAEEKSGTIKNGICNSYIQDLIAKDKANVVSK